MQTLYTARLDSQTSRFRSVAIARPFCAIDHQFRCYSDRRVCVDQAFLEESTCAGVCWTIG